MKLGCHSRSAFCSFLSLESATLLGILSNRSDIVASYYAPNVMRLSLPVEARALRVAVERERALVAHRVRTLKDPVLPSREPAENLRLHRLRSRKAQARFHAGERVG